MSIVMMRYSMIANTITLIAFTQGIVTVTRCLALHTVRYHWVKNQVDSHDRISHISGKICLTFFLSVVII